MEDSLKGILTTLTIAGIFITAILSFIFLFIQGQGTTFPDTPSQDNYLVATQLAQTTETGITQQLSTSNNASKTGFDQWDITLGQMGSNAIKQSTGITGNFMFIMSSIKTLAIQVFGMNSPVVTVLGILILLGIGYLLYALIQWVRTGR